MSARSPPAKRPRRGEGVVDVTLAALCARCQWEEATVRARSHPDEAHAQGKNENSSLYASSSPLALSCRYGAPLSCVKAILDASPSQLHRLVPSRGTPLHEAIVCDKMGLDVISSLLKVDEELSQTTNVRATLLQDVDGHTPLHLLIRRRFSFRSASNNNESDPAKDEILQLLQRLVASCPEAVGIPDRGEYEEPPLVMALKASLYAVGTDVAEHSRVERRIHQMVACMLSYHPAAAAQVLKGARGQYTALHSAVFHGRCPDTIQLLLQAEQSQSSLSKQPQAALLANTQGELPLHFCAMRGESPRSLCLLAHAAPKAVVTRDASGLTPLHWLWVRFVSTLLVLGKERGETTLELSSATTPASRDDPYVDFSAIETGHFDPDFFFIRRLDPPVDFLRMRHIPSELLQNNDDFEEESTATQCANASARVLSHVRSAHQEAAAASQALQDDDENDQHPRDEPQALQDEAQPQNSQDDDENSRDEPQAPQDDAPPQDENAQHPRVVVWTRRDATTCLFWTKVVSLLRAAHRILPQDDEEFRLVHCALECPACPPLVARLVCVLFSQELPLRDEAHGRLPLHHAARRQWHEWDWPRDDGETTNASLEGSNNPTTTRSPREPAAVQLLRGETLQVLETALALSPPAAARITDKDGRLVLHHVIDTFVAACSRSGRSYMVASHRPLVEAMLSILKHLVQVYPESLERRDGGKTKLYPFLQASAAATHHRTPPSNGYAVPFPDEMPLSIVYVLLRENPSLVQSGLGSS